MELQPVEHNPFDDAQAIPKPGQSIAPGLTPQALRDQSLGTSRAFLDAVTPQYLKGPSDQDIAQRQTDLQLGRNDPGKIPAVEPMNPAPFAAVDALGMLPLGGAAKVGAAAAGAGAKLAPLLSMFAGPAARTADHAALDLAQQMLERGMDKRQIWDATGWFTGRDGKWRFEIPDNAAKMTGMSNFPMPGVIEHPQLYEAYPELNRTQVHGLVPKGALGAVHPDSSIGVAREAMDDPSILLHEGQHVIQRNEGFAPGGNSRAIMQLIEARYGPRSGMSDEFYNTAVEAAQEGYRRLAGEVEARNVQSRLNMTPAQRRAAPPWTTEDVPREQQIVRKVKLEPVEGNPFKEGHARGGRVAHKLPHLAVGYVNKSRIPDKHCSVCSMYETPASCTIVRDPIHAGGWCRRFNAKGK